MMSKSPEFEEGSSEFTFPNGDRYVGDFCAHRSGLVWREGRGTYFTHDGQVYEGEWKDDRLVAEENLKVAFPNGDEFYGKILKNKFNGSGTYGFKNGASLVSNFVDNKPTGEIIFIDYLGNCWYGTAENERAFLLQEHVFFSELDDDRGRGVPKHPKIEHHHHVKAASEGTSNSSTEVDLEELERLVFAKSLKTPADIDFEDSDWFRDYKEYKEMLKTVMKKLETGDTSSLSAEEAAWYQQYQNSRKILEQRCARPVAATCSLLDLFFSEKFVKSCPPVRVFYAKQDSDEAASV